MLFPSTNTNSIFHNENFVSNGDIFHYPCILYTFFTISQGHVCDFPYILCNSLSVSHSHILDFKRILYDSVSIYLDHMLHGGFLTFCLLFITLYLICPFILRNLHFLPDWFVNHADKFGTSTKLSVNYLVHDCYAFNFWYLMYSLQVLHNSVLILLGWFRFRFFPTLETFLV